MLHSYDSVVRIGRRISMFKLVVLEAVVLLRVVVVILNATRLLGLHPLLGATSVIRACMVGCVLALFSFLPFFFIIAVSVALGAVSV